MAIDIKKMVSASLLELCQKQDLEKITIQQLLNHTGISRQTFYNHFIDKDDLIHYIYLTYIIPDFQISRSMTDFHRSLLQTLENMRTYHYFMKQACLMNGQNCLKEFMFQHCQEFDLSWHQQLYGSKPMSDALRFATQYHATASSSMVLSWICSNMPVTCEELADMIVSMRSLGMDILFKDGEHTNNPYIKD